ITFWRNGFSIEDGPLLDYNDPANAEILRAIDQGQAPADLLNVRYGQPVELRVARRMHEDYIQPQPRPHQAFEGAGNRLGAPTPTFPTQGLSSGTVSVSATATASVPVPAVPREDRESLQTKYEVDDTQETTTVAIQLADGTRMRMRMNLTSTVRDIRNIINAARPENLTRSYTIQTMRPTRILGEDTQTIQAAGLQRSLVVQRW
ncbi:SEP-domain-containing protein, partial [Fomitiporia mediterranea MF3/22]|uniref:SEP-domain-containing protein n=1 Tax=Fomitiporia mediterranea (strain MF3/22) TaxID=694068 RepID=UPI0004409217